MDNKIIRHFGKNTLNEFLEELKERVVDQLHELEQALPKKLSDLENDLEMATTWDDLEDKPFYDTRVFEEVEVEKNLTFDGVLEGKEYVQYDGDYLVKISDSTYTKDELLGNTITVSYGETIEIIDSHIQDLSSQNIPITVVGEGAGAVFIAYEDCSFMGVDFTKGTWFIYSEYWYVSSSSLTYTVKEPTLVNGELKQLDEQYIPDTIAHADHIHSWNDLEDKPFCDTRVFETIEVEKPLTFDGLENCKEYAALQEGLEIYYCKISDHVYTPEELLNATFILNIAGQPHEQVITEEQIVDMEQSGYPMISVGDFLIVAKDDFVLPMYNINFTKGTWTMYIGETLGTKHAYLSSTSLTHVVKETTGKVLSGDFKPLDDQFISEYVAKQIDSHTHSYNNLTDRTHYSEITEGLHFTWDGKTEWLVTDTHSFTYNGEEKSCIKVSSDIPIKKELQHVSGIIRYREGSNRGDHEFNIQMSDFIEENGYIYMSNELLGIESDVTIYLFILQTKEAANSFGLAKPGIYASYETGAYTGGGSNINYYFAEINIDTVEDVLRLDEKFLPDTISRTNHIHSYNDLTDKTHYDTRNNVELYNDDCSIFVFNGVAMGTLDDVSFDNNKNIKVIYDGTEYNLKSYNFQFVQSANGNVVSYSFIGNGQMLINMYENNGGTDIQIERLENTDLPFVITSDMPSYATINTNDTENSTHTIVIQVEEGELKQLDEKFLPDSVKSGGTQSDWNVNDENNPAYIANRPFYTADPQHVEIVNGTYEFTNSGGAILPEDDMPFYENSLSEVDFNEEDFNVNKGITVVYDGNTYNLILKESIINYGGTSMPLGLYAGNISLLSEYFTTALGGVSLDNEIIDTGEPFVFNMMMSDGVIITKDSSPTHDIIISINKPVDITIPKKYLGFPVWAGTGKNSIVIGDENGIASGDYAVCEGVDNEASGKFSYAEGNGTTASGESSHSEGYASNATGNRSHAENSMTVASGFASHAEGHCTISAGYGSHSEGSSTYALDGHAEGSWTAAVGSGSHAEGSGSDKTKFYITVSWNDPSDTILTVNSDLDVSYKHLLLYSDILQNMIVDCTVVDNKITTITLNKIVGRRASSNSSQQVTFRNVASGQASHVEGVRTLALGDYQHVQGKYNALDEENKYAHIVGNGTSEDERSNAHTLDWDGNAWYQGSVEATALILKSPNGTRFSITIGDDGVLSASEITE